MKLVVKTPKGVRFTDKLDVEFRRNDDEKED